MSKFHISKHGVPAVCKATKGHGLEDNTIKISPRDYETRDSKFLLSYELALYISDEDLEIYKEHLAKFDNPRDHAKENYELISSMKIDDDKFIANMNKKGIEISDYYELNEAEQKAMIFAVNDRSIRKIRNIMSFLTSDKNTSYSKDKSYEKTNAKGSFDDVYYKLKLMNNVGWAKRSDQAANDENSMLNVVMDKKSIDIAEKITKESQVNQESRTYPDSGMIYGIQMLRHRGIDEREIIDRSHNERVADMVYKEYDANPRETSGATQLARLLQQEANAQGKENIHELLKESLNWTE